MCKNDVKSNQFDERIDVLYVKNSLCDNIELHIDKNGTSSIRAISGYLHIDLREIIK